jgi:ABC-type cobalamin/Fe3+-siderophores transport system ATPase subunit
MKFVKQTQTLEVNNIQLKKNSERIKHSTLLPNTIRCVICGPSNCGKTNVMLNLLLHENGLKFKYIYLFTKTPFQAKYIFLRQVIEAVPQAELFIFNESKEVLHPNDARANSIMIFDDVACENQINIRNYFAMGRHRQIDCFYLSQTYSKIPKQLLRDNVNMLIVFKQDDTNLRH